MAQRFQRPSYVVGLWLERDKTTLADSHGVSVAEYAPHGGALPIRVHGVGVVGTVTVSGVPHATITASRWRRSRACWGSL